MLSQQFEYRVRVSPHSRNVRLRVTARKGLEVIVPRGYDTSTVPGLLKRKTLWIRTALERAEVQRKFFEPEPKWRVPLQITLPGLSRTWHVNAVETGGTSVRVREVSDGTLVIRGAIRDEATCRTALSRWLMRLTHRHLRSRLETLSLKTGLKHRRIFVKRPKTRWASCSRHCAISLNAKLLFLKPELVDYVMIHETQRGRDRCLSIQAILQIQG
jgi:hypothetical protein